MYEETTVFFLIAFGYPGVHAQQLVRASGAVKMVTTPTTKIVVNGGMTFLGTSDLTDSGTITLYNYTAGTPGNWLDSTTSGVMNVNSNGSVYFNGSVRQSFYGKTRFYNLYIRNTNGDTLLSSCEVRNILNLDTGYVYTRSGYGKDSLWVSNPAVAAIVSTSNFTKSWVDGRLSRTGNVSAPAPLTPYTNSYFFPVGKTDSLYAPVRLSKFNTNSTTWTMEYFDGLPYDYTNTQNPPIDHLSRMEYWEISSNAVSVADDDAFISLSWRGHSKVSSSAAIRDSLMVAEYANNPPYKWIVPGGWVTGRVNGPDSLSGYVTSNTAGYPLHDSSQRRFTLATYSKFNALPIQLFYFTALADGNKVRLNWDIANEENIQYYELQKSLNGTSFSHLTTVASLQQARSQYVDYDYNPVTGWNYYRIKLVDKTGSYTYSPVRAVKFDKGLEEVKIFPDPATTILNIQLPSSYAGKVNMQVYSVDGKYISSMKPTVNVVQMNVMRLPAGTYILKLTQDNGNISNYRFVKQ